MKLIHARTSNYILVAAFLVLYTTITITTASTPTGQIPWVLKQIDNGPIYAFVKTDKDANIKWGVRHYIPRGSVQSQQSWQKKHKNKLY